MAWITPVTNRRSGLSRISRTDMNRIAGNINHVYDLISDLGFTITGGKVSPATWIQNDIISKTFWEGMLTVLQNVCSAISYTPDTDPDNAMTYQNLNNVESITLALYLFANDDWLLDDSGVILATESDELILAVL